MKLLFFTLCFPLFYCGVVAQNPFNEAQLELDLALARKYIAHAEQVYYWYDYQKLDSIQIYAKEALDILDAYVETQENQQLWETYIRARLWYSDWKSNFFEIFYDWRDHKEKTLFLAKEKLGKKHVLTGMATLSLAPYYSAVDDFEKALELYLESYSLVINTSDQVLLNRFLSAYSQVAWIYSIQGFGQKAVDFMYKLVDTCIEKLGKNHPCTYDQYSTLGVMLHKWGDSETAEKLWLECLKFNTKYYGKQHYQVFLVKSYLGYLYLTQNKLKESKEMVLEVNELGQKLLGPKDPGIADSNADIGRIYWFQGNLKTAMKYLQKAVNLVSPNNKSPEIFGYLYNLITISKQRDDWNSMESYANHLVKHYLPNFDSISIEQNYNKDLTPINKTPIIYGLNILGSVNVNRFENSKNPKFLAIALSYYELALQLENNPKLKFDKDQSFIKNEIRKANTQSISIHLNPIIQKEKSHNKAFLYSEKNKAYRLNQALSEVKAQSSGSIPLEITQTLNQIKKEVDYYELKLAHDTMNVKPLAPNYVNSRVKIYDLKAQKDSLTRIIEKDYPEYYRIKYQPNTLTATDVQQKLLDPQTALIEYYVDRDTSFAFVLTDQEVKAFPLLGLKHIAPAITKLQKSLFSNQIQQSFNPEFGTDTLLHYSHYLYQQLLAPIAAEVDLPKKLVIVPDRDLGYIPFDVLLKEIPSFPQNFKEHQYLIKDHQISYCYSATLLHEMQQKKSNASGGFLGFAPTFEGDDADTVQNRSLADLRNSLSSLQFNQAEIEEIHQSFGGMSYTGLSATEDNFLKEAPNYRIIHLATHAKANDKMGDFSYLAFTPIEDTLENELLYNRNLYSLRLNADMVVLSACETGIGELKQGEGIISLARGFSFAGAKSIISSLWSVNDEATKVLMTSFYAYLKEGRPKDEALRLAKLDFIENYQGEAVHPFYWAGFIAIGDMSPIELSGGFTWWFAGLMVVLTAAGLVWFWRKKRTGFHPK